MTMRKPSAKTLAARRKTRLALAKARRAVRDARRDLLKTAVTTEVVTKTVFPPQTTSSVCKTIATEAIVLFPPVIPRGRCRPFFPPRSPVISCGIPPKEITVTRRDFVKALDAIDLWIGYLLAVLDAIHGKRPPRPVRKPKR